MVVIDGQSASEKGVKAPASIHGCRPSNRCRSSGESEVLRDRGWRVVIFTAAAGEAKKSPAMRFSTETVRNHQNFRSSPFFSFSFMTMTVSKMA